MGNPWTILATWLIDRRGLPKTLHLAHDPQSRMKGFSLWQALNFFGRQTSGAGIPGVHLLDRIRRLVLLSENRGLRQLPRFAEGIDAVRLMTIHGSKGHGYADAYRGIGRRLVDYLIETRSHGIRSSVACSRWGAPRSISS